MRRVTGRGILAVALLTLAWSPLTRADDPSPVERAREAGKRQDAAALLQALGERYRGLDTIAIKGEVVHKMSAFGRDTTKTTAFSVKAGRDGRYLVEWSMRPPSPTPDAPTPPARSGAIWNGGGEPSIYLSSPGVYAVEASDAIVMGMAAVLSARAAVLPMLVVPSAEGLNPLLELTDPSFDGEEAVDGEACWKISGASKAFERETLWISKRRVIIRRRESSLMPSPQVIEEMAAQTEDIPDEDFAALGVAVTPEGKKRVEDITAMMMDMMKVMTQHKDKIKGVYVEQHRKVQLNPTFGDDHYTYQVPPGTPKSDSIVERALKGPTARPTD